MPLPTPATGLRAAWSAFPAWWRSFSYLRQHRLRGFHWAGPGLLVAISLAGWAFTRWLADDLKQRLGEWTGGWDSAPSPPAEDGSWWSGLLPAMAQMLEQLVEWGVFLLVLWLKVMLTKYLLITLMAPIMSALAARIKVLETGVPPTPGWNALLRDLVRGVRMSAVLLILELSLGLALWLLGVALALFAPPLAVLAAPMILLVSWLSGAYFFGAAIHDAVYEQAGFNWRASLSAGWSQRGRLFGIGAIFYLWLGIPIIGPFVATLLGPVPCTTAAALLHFRTHDP